MLNNMNLLLKKEDHFKKLTVKRKLTDDQAKKSVGRMPWHQEPMKDVISCEKLR